MFINREIKGNWSIYILKYTQPSKKPKERRLSVFQYIDGPVTLYFSIDGYFGGWSVLEVVNTAALKTEVKVSFYSNMNEIMTVLVSAV